MKTSTAVRQHRSTPAIEPQDLADCFTGSRGLELVMEMAHDLRSPLTSIIFLAESLQLAQAGPVNDTQRRQLGLIRSAALSLCASASNVLELARGGHRLVDRETAPFSIGDVFGAVRDLVIPLAEEKRLDLRFLAPTLDRRRGHERALSRVLLNLTTNALKFTERGHVEVGARETKGSRVEFSVRDTGPGIDADALRTLYQPFRSGPSSPRQHFSHSGLGLAICRRLVAAMGSQLTMKTRPGWGTKFSFEIDLPPVSAFV
jgi:signal transduction histidine kinase